MLLNVVQMSLRIKQLLAVLQAPITSTVVPPNSMKGSAGTWTITVHLTINTEVHLVQIKTYVLFTYENIYIHIIFCKNLQI